VRNGTESTIAAGKAVYVIGSTGLAGTNMLVGLADYSTEATSSKTLGVMAESIDPNNAGYVVTEGLVEGLDTSAAGAAGDPIWLGDDGNFIYGLINKPSAPNHLVFIGVVTRKQQNNGEIFVRPQNGFELHELHNVEITNPQPGDTIYYNATTSEWYNAPSVTGPQGVQGLLGPTGPTGPTGPAGAAAGITYKAGVPASKTSTGTIGQLSIDGANGVFYICTEENTWQKVSLNSANFTNPGGFV